MVRRSVAILVVLFVVLGQWTVSQSKPAVQAGGALRFMDQIEEYTKQDSIAPPAKGTILFIGSSIFRQWKMLKEQMAPLPVFNRAFGGSHTAEILLHMDELVFPHAPRVIVYYCGSNDVNANVPTREIAGNFFAFVDSVHSRLPDTKIAYVAINRAPQKMDRWGVVDSVNMLVRTFCGRSPALTYIDVNPSLFDSAGTPRYELYKNDKLHFKDEAYVGFTAIIKPILAKIWSTVKPRTGGAKIKLSLNAYSFNGPLVKKSMDIEGLLEFCADAGFEAVDITGYYFPNYPAVPSDEYIMRVRKRAFLLGLDISGTGVRNDFANPDAARRSEDVQLVKNWIEVAAKLGAPVVRIFAGKLPPGSVSWDEAAQWMVKDIRECVEYGKKFGVMVAIQNHNDFIKTADEALRIISMVNSEWFGLILDTGSFRADDPYAEIAKAAPYAVNWQVKENIMVKGDTVKTDLRRIVDIIRTAGYRGYVPIETLGPGDPPTKVRAMLQDMKKAL